MRPDPNDVDFIDNIKRLIGINAKGVEALLPKLDPDVLIDLAAAVTNSDRRTVQALILAGRRKAIAAVSEDRMIDHKQRGRRAKDAPSIDDPDESAYGSLNVGDDVTVDGVSGTVKLPKAPGNTVGVMIKGNLEMVQRNDVALVAEGVFAISAIPDLRRMQELAGIASDTAGPDADVGLPGIGPKGALADPSAPLSTETVDLAPTMRDPTQAGAQAGLAVEAGERTGSGADALGLLDQLASMLPDLRLADIKSLRKRINDITMQMNETVGFAGRQAVVERRAAKTR